MKRFMNKKVATIGLAAGLALGAAGAAFAYFTSTGNGTGSATVGSATNWSVGESGTPSGGPLYPDASIAVAGGHVQTDGYTVTNGASGSQQLTQVVISVANTNGSAWSARADLTKPACTASDFSIDGAAVGTPVTDTALAGDYTAGETNTSGSVTVEMIDNTLNQDNCQGVTVPLYFSAS